jgi:tRNA G46 methylase TrmB
MFYNPYREKIEMYPNIWNDEEKICSQKGQWKALFNKERLMLEIGTGMGNFFSHYAYNNPEI